MAGFRYPGDGRWQALLRRQLIGSLMAGVLVVVLFGLRRTVGDDVIQELLSVAGISKDRIDFGTSSGSWLVAIGILIFGWILSGRAPIRSIEFHLFPWFDEDTMRPIKPQTGLLAWVDIPDSPANDAARRLREWVKLGIHDGRWPLEWILRGRPGLKERAFRYAFLLGPNGVGKSQLVREMARGLASLDRPEPITGANSPPQPTAFRQLLHAWWRRVSPFARRAASDPWDAGEIVIIGDWTKRIEQWLPAAPTLLVLDDPYGAYASNVIDRLDENSGRFWYSVRLIIVDQFIPPGLNLRKIGSDYRDLADRPVPLITIGDIRWDGRQYCAAVAKGLWIADPKSGQPRFNPAKDVKAFWDALQMGRVCDVLDGNPLMLAEAAHWLAKPPYRTIEALLRGGEIERFEVDAFTDPMREAFREQVAHRILGERVDELFNSHITWEEQNRRTDHSLIEAIACAAIAGGVPLVAFSEASGLMPLPSWLLVLPHAGAAMATIPAPGSWPICDAYVQRVLADLPTFRLAALVLKSYRTNPVGVTRAFGRRGRLAEEIVRIIIDAELGSDPDADLGLDLFLGAATRAMWSSRAAVPQALSLLDRLPDAMLRQSLDRLEQLGAALDDRVPDTVVALLLLTKLGERRIASGIDFASGTWKRFSVLWERWLARPGVDLRYVPAALLDPLKQSYRALCQHVLRGVGILNDPHAQFEQLRDFYLLGDIRSPLIHEWEQDWASEWAEPNSPKNWVALYRALFRIESLSWRDHRLLPNGSTVLDEAAAVRRDLKVLGPPDAQAHEIAFVETDLWATSVRTGSERKADFPAVEEALRRADAAAAPFPERSDVQARRASAHVFCSKAQHRRCCTRRSHRLRS